MSATRRLCGTILWLGLGLVLMLLPGSPFAWGQQTTGGTGGIKRSAPPTGQPAAGPQTNPNAPPAGGRPLPQTAPPNSAGAQPQPAERPQGAPLRVEPVSPELEKVLRDWERETSKITRLQGEHWQYTYDKVFQVEFRGKGEFLFEAPDKGSYLVEGVKIDKSEVSRKKGDDGQPYTLKAHSPERWVCTGKEILKIDDKDKTYELVTIPPEDRGQNIINGPLPFLFGMKAEVAKRRYSLKLLDLRKDAIWISARPRLQQDAANYQEATIIIDPVTFLPHAVRLIDPSGNKETVHKFANLKVNKPRALLMFQEDPLSPKLGGYKLVDTSVRSARSESRPGTGGGTGNLPAPTQGPFNPPKSGTNPAPKPNSSPIRPINGEQPAPSNTNPYSPPSLFKKPATKP